MNLRVKCAWLVPLLSIHSLYLNLYLRGYSKVDVEDLISLPGLAVLNFLSFLFVSFAALRTHLADSSSHRCSYTSLHIFFFDSFVLCSVSCVFSSSVYEAD